MQECIEVMASLFCALARGEALLPLRTVVRLPNSPNVLASMPGYAGAPGAKVITVFPGNHGTPRDSHQGAVLLFDGDTGSLAAVVDATAITRIRTAAASAVATRALARVPSATLAILGAGVQAFAHIEAISLVRPIASVRIWSRDHAHAHALSKKVRETLGLDAVALTSARDAVRDAAIVCTVTSSPTPVLEGAWLAPGTHVNAVGACLPAMRETDTATVARSKLYVDRRESTLNESGDVLIPLKEGAIAADHIRAELGEVLLGHKQGRENDQEITLFKSLGLAVQDLAAAAHVLDRAESVGAGVQVKLGGSRAS